MRHYTWIFQQLNSSWYLHKLTYWLLMCLSICKTQSSSLCAFRKEETRHLRNLFSKWTKDYSVRRKRSISMSYETLISHESFWEKIKTKKFGLWPLSIKCDNTELLFYVTKLRMNKLRWDEFVPFDIIWKTSSGMDSHCSTVSFHCPPNRLTVIHQGAWE